MSGRGHPAVAKRGEPRAKSGPARILAIPNSLVPLVFAITGEPSRLNSVMRSAGAAPAPTWVGMINDDRSASERGSS